MCNLVEKGPKFTVLDVPQLKILFVSQPWLPTFLKTFSHLLKNSIWIVLYEICSIFSIWKIVLYEIHYYANPILHFCDWFMVIAIKFRHEVLHFLMCDIPWASENYHQRYLKSTDMDGWWTIACWQNRAIYASSFFFNVKVDALKPPLVYDRLSPVFQRPWFYSTTIWVNFCRTCICF